MAHWRMESYTNKPKAISAAQCLCPCPIPSLSLPCPVLDGLNCARLSHSIQWDHCTGELHQQNTRYFCSTVHHYPKNSPSIPKNTLTLKKIAALNKRPVSLSQSRIDHCWILPFKKHSRCFFLVCFSRYTCTLPTSTPCIVALKEISLLRCWLHLLTDVHFSCTSAPAPRLNLSAQWERKSNTHLWFGLGRGVYVAALVDFGKRKIMPCIA